ncbi:glycine zipper family protein [Methylobacter tundripaludum]|uniref:glycine zipper family protein n=1 Tax=Methylobacter tundripaludum TaxID=173365 RepID=UPI0004879187|nr:glycine zipper family protein [Methylobacter tundripaludum]
MRRIYFLVPNIAITHKIVEELQAEGIEDRHIHILAKRDTPLEGLPEAGIAIKTDFLPAVERGVALGGTTGLLAGLIGLRFAGFAIAGGPLLGIIMAGATIGSLMGGLAGMNSGNSRLRQFEEAIERGELLVLIDIPKDRIEAIRKLVIKHHPEAEFEGIEPILPPSY